MTPHVVLGIHGGTGEDKKDMTPELEVKVRAVLNAAIKAGKAKLDAGGTSLDAVEEAIRVMEDDPTLNAGRGSVFTSEGRNELDASIMDGKTKKAGSVAGVTIIKNPILNSFNIASTIGNGDSAISQDTATLVVNA